jgi:hypothetical protein
MKTLFLLALMTVVGAVRADDCDYTIQMGSFTAAVKETPQTLPHTLILTRGQNSSNGNCQNYRVFFAKGYANSYQRRAYSGLSSLPYNIYSSVNQGNILKDHGDAGAGEYLTGYAPDKDSPYTTTWYVGVSDIYTLFTTPPGVYTDVVPINVYNVKNNGTLEYSTTRYLTLSFSVPRFAEVSLVPVNAGHDPNATTYVMDFGTLETSEELAVDLRVVGNVGFAVMMSSMNGGSLANVNGGTIPYQMKVGNGSYFTFSGSGPYQVASSSSGTSTQGIPYTLRVRIGTVLSNVAGDYQDSVTITVQAW